MEKAEQWVVEPAEVQDERSGAGRLTGEESDLGGAQMWAREGTRTARGFPEVPGEKRFLGKPGLVN